MNAATSENRYDTPLEELGYEQAFNELEEIVYALENEEHTLERALFLFERGKQLVRHCGSLLDQAELKIQQLNGDTLTDFSLRD